MSPDEAAAFALAVPAARPPPGLSPGGPGGPAPGTAAGGGAEVLTPREREVAGLIAAGCRSNRQLAARLTVTPATAGVHVQHILEKLGLHSRWQIADRASGPGRPETPPARAG
jgi:DNA-binding NarL/FixJ family response regulator